MNLLAILSDLKSCQFAPWIVIFILYICCQFEDSQIISSKIIPVSHHNIYLWQKRAHFLFLLVHKVRIFRKPNQDIIVSERIFMWSSAEWVKRTAFSGYSLLILSLYSLSASWLRSRRVLFHIDVSLLCLHSVVPFLHLASVSTFMTDFNTVRWHPCHRNLSGSKQSRKNW